ncbi:MAG: hypothetical protein V3T90_15730, partial [Anaerolineae bacterium]
MGGQYQTVRRCPALQVARRHSPSATSLTAGAWRFLQPHAAQSTPDAPVGDAVWVAVLPLGDGPGDQHNLFRGD